MLRIQGLFVLTVFVVLGCGKVVPIGEQPDAALEVDAAPLGPCDGEMIAIDDLYECVLSAQCEFLVRCEGAAASVEECIENFGAEIQDGFQRTKDAVGAGVTIYDPTEAAVCLQSFGNRDCALQGEEDCDGVFVGTVAEGGACYDGDECAGVDARCQREDCTEQCCVGTCLDAAKIGEDCSLRSCADDARCVSSVDGTANYTCVTGDVDSSCQSDNGCDYELFCQGQVMGTEGVCTAARSINLPCGRDRQCEGNMDCVGDTTVGDTGTCLFTDTLGAVCDGSCNGGLRCDRSDGELLGTCVARASENMACESNNDCELGLLCPDGVNTCQPRPGVDQSCKDYQCSQNLFCTSELDGSVAEGVCAEPMVTGNACSQDRHCETDICVNQVCEAYMSCF